MLDFVSRSLCALIPGSSGLELYSLERKELEVGKTALLLSQDWDYLPTEIEEEFQRRDFLSLVKSTVLEIFATGIPLGGSLAHYEATGNIVDSSIIGLSGIGLNQFVSHLYLWRSPSRWSDLASAEGIIEETPGYYWRRDGLTYPGHYRRFLSEGENYDSPVFSVEGRERASWVETA